MICSKCNQEAKDGRVKKGVFICNPCLAADKTAGDVLITRYANAYPMRRADNQPIKIVSAKYKEGPKYWIKKEADGGWPWRAEKEPKGYRNVTPGYDSPQEVINAVFRQQAYDIQALKDALRKQEERMSQIRQFCQDNGYKVPEEE